MGMKAKVGLLALLVATVAGAIAFDKFRAKHTTTATDQVELQKGDTPGGSAIAATPAKGHDPKPVKEIVAAPKPKPPDPPLPRPTPPATPPPVAPGPRADSVPPLAAWDPTHPLGAAKPLEPSHNTPTASGVDIVHDHDAAKPTPPSGSDMPPVVRPPTATPETPKPALPTPAPAAPDTYVIASGDSLYVISQKVYGTTKHWREIFEANRDTLEAEDRLVVGKKIRIPHMAEAPAPTPKAADVPAPVPVELAGKKTHTVKSGENLSTISKLYFKESKYWQKIAEANSKFLKDPHDLKVGMVLVIPELEQAAPPAAPAAAGTPAQPPGPELDAKKFHVVAGGDSLSTISQKYFGSTKHWKAIFEANRKVLSTPDDLVVGMKLVIPAIEQPPAPAAGTPPATPKAPTVPAELAALGTPYTVQEGDTLAGIAIRLLGSETEWSRIYELNKGFTMKDADHLSPGMVIVIPKKAEKAPADPPKAPEPPKAPAPKPEPPKPPALSKVPTPPAEEKKSPAPPKKDDSGSSTGSKLGIE